MRYLINIILAALVLSLSSHALGQAISKILVEGNGKVESDAIISTMQSRVGEPIIKSQIRMDIKRLYELGYFSNVKVYSETKNGKLELIISVTEKPSITSIEFVGMEEVTKEDIEEKLETKVFTILNEDTITTDMRMIEKEYTAKGYYLANVTHTIRQDSQNTVALVFHVEESDIVLVGNIFIEGNKYFSDLELLDKFMSQPLSRSSNISDNSIFREDAMARDTEFLSYYYKDFGFAKVQVSTPVTFIDSDRKHVRVTFNVKEGIQYHVESIDVTGDLLYDKSLLLDEMKLKPGELFKFTYFAQHDIEYLVNKYGDKGYAYADINPITVFDDKKKTVTINYKITKGPKVYFGRFNIVGNVKTRDNVIRRELEIQDSNLYSGTKLTKSKANIQRLGFFENVLISKERDPVQENVLNMTVQIEEKPTGQIQASVGYTPATNAAAKSTWFGQGSYKEDNMTGRAWATNLTGKYTDESTYSLKLSFTDPRVNDSIWSFGSDVGYVSREARYIQGFDVLETSMNFGMTVSRKIIELIRGSIRYSRSFTDQKSDEVIIDRFKRDGILSALTFGLSRRELDNYLMPSDGTSLSLRHKVIGGPVLGGDYQFQETTFKADYYIPLNFTDNFKTYFKLSGNLGVLSTYQDQVIPITERYKLGGSYNLRGFDSSSIGPHFSILRGPFDQTNVERYWVNRGGDKQMYYQFEYFLPLIPEAGLKTVLFADAGRVYDDHEKIEFKGLYKDVGFGIRWHTPMAPFRFEWAFPIEEDGSLGRLKNIFSIGF